MLTNAARSARLGSVPVGAGSEHGAMGGTETLFLPSLWLSFGNVFSFSDLCLPFRFGIWTFSRALLVSPDVFPVSPGFRPSNINQI
jgi:hypothetical protein